MSDIQALRYFPVFVFLVIIMCVGVIGNALVLFVYCKRFRKTSSNYFIVAMAIFDLLACLIGLPTEIYDLRNSFTFYNSTVCKIFRYSESVVVYGSAIILTEIAVDRYFKICRPLTMIEINKIRIMCIAAGVAAVLISIPALILFGISRTPISANGIVVEGYDCSIEEQYRKQTFSKVYYYSLASVFIMTVILLSGLYIRIWIEIKRRKNLVIGDGMRAPPREEIPMTYQKPKEQIKPKRVRLRYSSDISDDDTDNSTSFRLSMRPRLQSIAERFRVSRTTVILFAVTVAFAISYLPALVVMICRSVIKDLEDQQTLFEQVVSKLFARFYFINNAINPLIYSFLNISFRRRCVSLVKQAFNCRQRKTVRRPTPFPDKTDSQKSNNSTNTKKELVIL